MNGLPLSVLDLAMVPDGSSSAEALADTTEVARRAEALGYARFWVAEHHNMATVASTSPPVLMAHLAANTSTIRVGSGGVMLPNHAPLAVAEQFALLEALYPGRIDLGVGRAPGTDQATAIALRGTADNRDAEDFPRHLLDVMGLLGDRRTDRGLWERFKATPVAVGSPLVVPLGSSGFSAQLAGILGLPFGFAHHFDMGGTVEAVGIYREHFRAVAGARRAIRDRHRGDGGRPARTSGPSGWPDRVGSAGSACEPDACIRCITPTMPRRTPTSTMRCACPVLHWSAPATRSSRGCGSSQPEPTRRS